MNAPAVRMDFGLVRIGPGSAPATSGSCDSAGVLATSWCGKTTARSG